MNGIAALALLARNDTGVPQGIVALALLVRNDTGVPQGIAAGINALAMTLNP